MKDVDITYSHIYEQIPGMERAFRPLSQPPICFVLITWHNTGLFGGEGHEGAGATQTAIFTLPDARLMHELDHGMGFRSVVEAAHDLTDKWARVVLHGGGS